MIARTGMALRHRAGSHSDLAGRSIDRIEKSGKRPCWPIAGRASASAHQRLRRKGGRRRVHRRLSAGLVCARRPPPRERPTGVYRGAGRKVTRRDHDIATPRPSASRPKVPRRPTAAGALHQSATTCRSTAPLTSARCGRREQRSGRPASRRAAGRPKGNLWENRPGGVWIISLGGSLSHSAAGASAPMSSSRRPDALSALHIAARTSI